MLVEVSVQSLGLDRSNNTPVVILKEKDGERVLPIWIGAGEASSIAMKLAGWPFSRPLTHDLLVSVIKELGGSLDKVVISRVVDNTYFAELIIHRGDEVLSIDARPSDSIAVALRTNSRILADDSLLEDVSVEISEEESVPLGHDPEDPLDVKANPETLKDYLRKLNPEDFGRFTP